jgi:hypothetical protein
MACLAYRSFALAVPSCHAYVAPEAQSASVRGASARRMTGRALANSGSAERWRDDAPDKSLLDKDRRARFGRIAHARMAASEAG